MVRPIRVLELRSVRGTGGGPEKTIMLGARYSSADAFDVTVCYIRDRRDEVFRLDERAQKLGVSYVEVLEKHSFDMSIWRSLRAIIRERAIDIVHAHEYKTDLLAHLLAKRTGVIPLATAHAWTGNSTRERLLYYPIDKRLLARFPRVIAVSTDIKNELVRHGADPARVTVILNGIDPEAFKRDPARRLAVRRELGIGDDEIVMGAVGRIERQKRFDLLLEAFARLRSAWPALTLAIAGDGSLRPALEAQAAQLGLAHVCRWLGHREDVAALHHAFDIFVQSSEYEGTPNAVLEAMAMETPTVATDVGGTRELAHPDEHALIVPPHDLDALTAAIERLLRDPAGAAARRDAARRRIETELSFAARTRRLEAIYTDLMARREATPRPLDGVARHA